MGRVLPAVIKPYREAKHPACQTVEAAPGRRGRAGSVRYLRPSRHGSSQPWARPRGTSMDTCATPEVQASRCFDPSRRKPVGGPQARPSCRRTGAADTPEAELAASTASAISCPRVARTESRVSLRPWVLSLVPWMNTQGRNSGAVASR